MKVYSKEYQIARKLLPSAMSSDGARTVIDFPPNLFGLRILDVGSGQSPCVSWLYSQGADAYAIDSKYADLRNLDSKTDFVNDEAARKITKQMGIQHASNVRKINKTSREEFKRSLALGHYIAALAGSLPFPDDSFDFAYSINCLGKGIDEYEDLFRQAVSECVRVLKPGSELQIWPYLGFNSSRNGLNQKEVFRNYKHNIDKINGGLDNPFRARIIKP